MRKENRSKVDKKVIKAKRLNKEQEFTQAHPKSQKEVQTLAESDKTSPIILFSFEQDGHTF